MGGEGQGIVYGIGGIEIERFAVGLAFNGVEVFDLRAVPGGVAKTEAALRAIDGGLVGKFGMDTSAALVVVVEAVTEFEPGSAVLFDIAEGDEMAGFSEVGAGEGAHGLEFGEVIEEAEVEGEIVDAPVDEGTAAGEGFVHGPGTVGVPFDEGCALEVLVVDMVDAPKFALVDEGFDKSEFWLEAGMAAGSFEGGKTRGFLDGSGDLLGTGRGFGKRLFKEDMFSSRERIGEVGQVKVGRGSDDNSIEGRISEQLAVVESPVRDVEFLGGGGGGGFSCAADPGDLGPGILLEGADEDFAVHAGADDAEGVGFGHGLLLCVGGLIVKIGKKLAIIDVSTADVKQTRFLLNLAKV